MKKAILWLFVFPLLQNLHAQHSWEMRVLPGFLVPHHEDMQLMMQHMTGVELGRQWRIDSGGSIDNRQYHPLAGASFTYFDLGNNINGEAYCLNGFYEAGLRLSPKSSLRMRLGVGVGYLTRQFDAYGNHQNRAIGSALNGFMQALAYFETSAARRIDVQMGLGMSHFSNGNWGQPNLGINLPGLLFGIKYKDKSNNYVRIKTPVLSVVYWEFSLRAGKRQMSIDDPRNIVNYLCDVVCSYPQNEMRRWRAGLNIFYDRTYVFEKFKPLPKSRLDQVTEIAITAGHEYKINKVGFITDLGFYLYRPDETKRMYYEAVGIRYYLTPNVVLVSRLKAHLTSADYFEWGITYQFGTKKYTKPGFINGFRWFFSGFKPVPE